MEMNAEEILASLPTFNSLYVIVVISVWFLCVRTPFQIFSINFIAQEPSNFSCILSPNQSAGGYEAQQCDIVDLQGNKTPCSEWDYGDLGKTNSIVTQWDLVCAWEPLVDLEQTIYMFGQMTGALFLTPLPDQFGRRTAILFGLAIHLCLSVVLMFSVNIFMFIALRYVMGCVNQMILTASYVLISEWGSVKYRAISTNSIMIFWGFGIIAMPGIAYLIREWRLQILAYSVIPNCSVFIFYFILPESLLFLITHGKYGQVEKTLKRLNRSTEQNTSDVSSPSKEISKPIPEPEEGISMLSAAKKIIRSPKMLVYSLALFWMSLCMQLTYYTTTMLAGDLSDDIYLNYVLSGAVEVPFVFVTMLISIFLPRTVLLFSINLLGFGFLLTYSLTNIFELALIGRGAVASGYIVQILFATEMFPTIVRSVGVGFFLVGENIGPVISGPITHLGWAPTGVGSLYFFLAIVNLVDAFVVSFLPETKYYNFAETVEEIESRPALSVWRHLTCAYKGLVGQENKEKEAEAEAERHSTVGNEPHSLECAL